MPLYSIWVLEYAFVPEFPVSGLVYGAHNQGTCKLPYAYVLVKGQGEVILVDCGHDNGRHGRVLAESFGVENWRAPEEVMAPCGVTPEDVTRVVITHAHFDHMGGMAAFPKARFYIQERELSRWVWALALDRRFRWLMSATDPGDIIGAVELARDGRLVSVAGDMPDLLPGIDLRLAPDTHTAGSQYVVVRNDGQRRSEDSWVLAGDLVYRFENLEGHDPGDPSYVPVGFAMGSQTNLLLATDEMAQAAGGDLRRVIPVHDARLGHRFPSPVTGSGLTITEVALADGEASAVG